MPTRRSLLALALFAAATSACSLTPDADAPGATRVVTWNVLRGFLDRTQVEPAQQWLREQAPDVVALQEVNGFTEERLRETARAWGHEHAVMAKERGYPVALTSRTPIEVVQRRLEGMHHGYLHARTAGLDDDLGTLQPGLVADLLVLDANPLEDIRAMRQIDSVWIAGRQLSYVP